MKIQIKIRFIKNFKLNYLLSIIILFHFDLSFDKLAMIVNSQ